MSEAKACFVIAPIGEPESDTRRRSDQVLKHIIAPAVEVCGYTAIRADQIDKPGIITSQVIQRVVGDPLVVADLSETNPNVFYELAIRHAIRKPLVQIIRKGDRIPFDVAGTRTIQVDHHDLDSVEAAKKEIRDQVKAVESDSAKMETPISVSLDLQILRQSENPEERSLADLMAAVSDLRAGVQKIESKLTASADPAATAGLKEAIEEMPVRIIRELSGGPSASRRRRRFDPFMMMRLADMTAGESGDPIGILVMLGFYRDDFPWLYEIGVVAYNRAKEGDWEGAQETIRSLHRAAQLAFDGPWADEYVGNRKELMMVMEELPMLLDRVLSRGREMHGKPRKGR